MMIFKPSKILLLEKIKENADYPHGILLDAGSGGLHRYDNMFPKVEKIISLDLDEKCNPDILAPIDNIPLDDSSLDSIICTQVIGDVPEPTSAIKEFQRILKKGGMVLLSESLMNELHSEPNDYWRFTQYGMEHLFEKNGFEIIKIERVGGFFAAIAQLKIRYVIERFSLYEKKNWNLLFAPALKIYGKTMLFLDKADKSKVNKKYAIGWLVIAKKV